MARVKSKLHQPQSSVSDGCVEICMVKIGLKSIICVVTCEGSRFIIHNFANSNSEINGLEYYCSKVLI